MVLLSHKTAHVPNDESIIFDTELIPSTLALASIVFKSLKVNGIVEKREIIFLAEQPSAGSL